MKKLITIIALLSSLSITYASLDHNIKYGQSGNQVSELQEFLSDKGFLKATPTGFFGLLTLKAVKDYQTSVNVPSTGYVGILTRTEINNELTKALGASNEAEITEIGTTTPSTTIPITPQIIYVPQYVFVTQPVPQTPIPAPTCTLSMDKIHLEYDDVARTLWTSENATIRYMTQTYDGEVHKSTATGDVIKFGSSNYQIPMTIEMTFVGPGGTTTCQASLQ